MQHPPHPARVAQLSVHKLQRGNKGLWFAFKKKKKKLDFFKRGKTVYNFIITTTTY